MAGVALAGLALVNTWIVTLRGRRGTYGTGLALVARLVPRTRPLGASKHHITSEGFNMLRGEVT